MIDIFESWGSEDGFYNQAAEQYDDSNIERLQTHGQVADRNVFDSDEDYYAHVEKVTGVSPLERSDFDDPADYNDYLSSVGGIEGFYKNSILFMKRIMIMIVMGIVMILWRKALGVVQIMLQSLLELKYLRMDRSLSLFSMIVGKQKEDLDCL